ncbi:hypothetical protein Slin15195_G013210 [Septoria linicola]|uniref:Glycosyltransferase family 31 protein n=1 Tax=Septoria linicola TaxID=215465 RepID=A0A9Q9EFS9_9PEZI|nr:hypothetical protein Slin14017_G013250 [Septoria linicola]USW48002.1 hypothetical protein Slin15195_G013210 [Septoria linicola]
MRRSGRGALTAPFRFLFGLAIAACGILPLLQAITWRPHSNINADIAPSVQAKSFKACKELPGADDVFVVLKTGATEFGHKFPVHMNTTLRCYPNYMVFSDHQELYQGQVIHDALTPLDDHIKRHHRHEFGLYNRVKEGGREVLDAEELSDRPEAVRHKTPAEAWSNVGWRLDKWKFLPMFQTTYETHPHFKWYLFIEADTYLFWSSLLQYIATLDDQKAFWAGAELFVAGTIIAHGGAGILVSNPGLKLFSNQYQDRRQQWTRFMDNHKAGDIVVARLMNVAGMLLTKSRPLFHEEAPGNDTYSLASVNSTQWCDPVITYHHVKPGVIEDMWNLEHELYAKYDSDFSVVNDGHRVPKRRDIFLHYLYPQMRKGPRDLWDNNCQENLGEHPSFDACRRSCEGRLDCLQYRYDRSTKQCFVHDKVQLGDTAPASSWRSGWMMDRIDQFIENAPACNERKDWKLVSNRNGPATY